MTKITMFDLYKRGGTHLRIARENLQQHAMNGDRLRWGSDDIVAGMTVRQIEMIACEIAAAAINEERERMEKIK
jgi:hypothetical protein